MWHIKKDKKEPDFLTDFKTALKKEEEENGIPVNDPFKNKLGGDRETKRKLQRKLAEEQGYICCYCQGEIKMKIFDEEHLQMNIEHYKPRSIYNGNKNRKEQSKKLCDSELKIREDLRLDYHNLFCACPGKGMSKDTHCDHKKLDKELCEIPNLASRDVRRAKRLPLRYNLRGGIIIDENDSLYKDIVEKLNLNCETLVQNRSNEWKGIKNKLKKIGGTNNISWNKKPRVIRYVKWLIDVYEKRTKGKHKQYADFILYLLRKRFKNELEN